MSIDLAARAPISQSRPAPDAHAPVAFHVVAELLRGLNREQRAAVTHGEGPLLVIAGPGTGKTEVITRRVAWLIASKRARPQEILALTFTDNAAQEMQARVDVLVPYGQAEAAIHTFHAFGDRLIREHSFELGLPGDVRLISRAEAIVLLREHMFELGLDRYLPLGDPTRFLGALADAFSRAKDENVTPDALRDFVVRARAMMRDDGVDLDAQAELATAFERYQRLLLERGMIDHADQISLALRMVRERPSIRAELQRRFRYLLVDEFQDMNRAQVDFVAALTAGAANVTVVGDPNQAIYRFRGAGGGNISRFVTLHESLRRIELRRNYRSRQPILEAASRLMSHSGGADGSAARQLAQRRGRSVAPVRSIWFDSPEQEADAVAQQIARAVADGSRPRDFAVLTRSNGEAESMARSLALHGVPVRTQLREDFFGRPQVRSLLAFLRVVADPHQTVELYALATSYPYALRGQELTNYLGQARRRHRSLWEVLQAAAADEGGDCPAGIRKLVGDVSLAIDSSHERSSGELLYQHIKRTGILGRLVEDPDKQDAAAVARFFDIVRSRASLLSLDRVAVLVPHLDALVEASDDAAESGPLDVDAVSVLTVHRAKGLQFRRVFLTGLTDGRFPARGRQGLIELPWREMHGEEASDDDALVEERRLCYVAMTRAQDELWLSHHVAGPGGRGRRRPSPFIAEALDAPSVRIPLELDAAARIEMVGTSNAQLPAVAASTRPVTELSFSEIETYLECPERYRLRHVVGVPGPAHHALSYGSALHRAVAAFHLSAASGGQPLSEEELLAEYRRVWTPEGFLSREHEEARYAAGVEALRRFRSQQIAAPSPVVAVERPFTVRVGDVLVRGRADRVDRTPEGDVIVDYKSSDVDDQAKADKKARESLQLQVYAIAHEAQAGVLPSGMQLHFLETGVTGTTRPDAERLEKARTKIAAAARGIAAKEFEATPNSFACGYCPYRQVCPKSAA